jgi:hypothetical protein
VTVSVGLDNGHEPRQVWERRSQKPHVALDGIEVDGRAGGTNSLDIKHHA